MLQLQQRTAACSSQSALVSAFGGIRCVPAHVVRRPQLAEDKPSNRRAFLTVQSGRGEEVVAFLPNDKIDQAAPATTQAVKVYTMDGRQFSLPLTSGITTVGAIRNFVAGKENAPIEKVRLAYAGRELDPAMDFQVFVPKPGINVMHAMHRMSGGGAAGGPPTPSTQ